LATRIFRSNREIVTRAICAKQTHSILKITREHLISESVLEVLAQKQIAVTVTVATSDRNSVVGQFCRADGHLWAMVDHEKVADQLK
jgi:hypothetical protein